MITSTCCIKPTCIAPATSRALTIFEALTQRARLQLLDCPFPGAISTLNLNGLQLSGYLPPSFSQLPLTYLDLSDNPRLRGVLPAALPGPRLAYVNSRNTSLSCDGDELSYEQVLAFTSNLRKLSAAQIAEREWTPAEQQCIDVAAHRSGSAVSMFRISIARHCRLPKLRDSDAFVNADYVFGIGCSCAGYREKLRWAAGAGDVADVPSLSAGEESEDSTLVCIDPFVTRLKHWGIVALMVLIMVPTSIGLSLAFEPANAACVALVKRTAHPGTVAIHGNVRILDSDLVPTALPDCALARIVNCCQVLYCARICRCICASHASAAAQHWSAAANCASALHV